MACVSAYGVVGCGAPETESGTETGTGASERCSSPSRAEVSALSADASTVARVAYREAGDVSDGTTDTTGWLVEPVATIAGTEPVPGADGRFVIWPTEAEGVPRAGEDLIVFVDPHRAETAYTGKAAPGYDVVRAGGVLVAADDGTVSRLCREERSDPVPASSLGV